MRTTPEPARIVLTITPGRSGSVFLADALRRSGGTADVTHERLGPHQTLPRVFFHAYDDPRLAELARFPPVAAFVETIDRQLQAGTTVVEVGMFSSHLVPAIARRYADRLRLIGLFRHPLVTAASHSVRGMYHPWPHWTFFSLANLTPFDPGMPADGCRERWGSLSPFARNLYAWMQYARLWQTVRDRCPQIPALEIRSEDLFADPATWCRRALDFAGLEGDVVLNGTRKNELEGKSTLRFGLPPGWRERLELPGLEAAARALGYRLDDPRVLAGMAKYEAPTGAGYRALQRAGWFAAKGYVGRLTRPRFWRYYRRWRRLRRVYPEYFRMMTGSAHR